MSVYDCAWLNIEHRAGCMLLCRGIEAGVVAFTHDLGIVSLLQVSRPYQRLTMMETFGQLCSCP